MARPIKYDEETTGHLWWKRVKRVIYIVMFENGYSYRCCTQSEWEDIKDTDIPDPYLAPPKLDPLLFGCTKFNTEIDHVR